jgi:4-hydroxy-tetrahydrodipicolinate reductase
VSRSIVAIGIHGASGRMGTRMIQLIALDRELELAAALERRGHPSLGMDAAVLAGLAPVGVPLCDALPATAAVDVMIDFSLPLAAMEVAELCQARKIPLVVGTTGFDAQERQNLESASTHVPILIAPNMSRAVNLLMRLVDLAARSLGSAADIAIVERHHRTKKDAPSGTALRLAEIAGQGHVPSRLVPGDPGDATEHRPGQISIHALRLADSPGEHTVVFGLAGETLELSHRALNRDGFARGALEAAKFLAGKPPGLYSMGDVLGC